MKLTVVIVNYNVKHYLLQCLDSVVRATRDIDTEIYVVDNVSTDASITAARKLFPQVQYIENTENVGFARANNQAIRASKGEYVLLLNPDTIVAEDTILAGITFLDAHPEAGATGTRMLNRDGSFALESRRSIPTPKVAFYKMAGLTRRFPHSQRFARYYLGHLNPNEANRIEVMSGAYMMLRRKALEEVGLLSEDYFMYGEDIDLSYQLLTHGWQNWYQPQLILHYKGESTRKDSIKYVHAFYNAMIIFFNKYLVKKYWLGAALIHLVVIIKGALEYFKQKSLRYNEKLQHATDVNKTPEHLLFFGTEEAFNNIKTRCLQAGYTISLAPTLHTGHFDATQLLTDYLYAVYQTDEGIFSYAQILRNMQQGAERGLHVHLGTYSTLTDTLILPNDVIE